MTAFLVCKERLCGADFQNYAVSFILDTAVCVNLGPPRSTTQTQGHNR